MIQNNSSETAQVWADRLDRFDQAEITVAQFCRNEDVSPASYYYWRRKFRGTTKTDHPPLRENRSAQPRLTARKLEGFLPVTLAAVPSPATVMAIDLPGGIRIRFEIPACNQEAGS
jgi:hypothetical protein